MGKIRLRTKFLLSLVAISAGLTSATLLVVRYRVERQVREAIREDLHNSVRNYESFERLREASLTRSARLIADLPNVRALMTTQHSRTIQDASKDIWQLSGSDLFVLASIRGEVLALQSAEAVFAPAAVQESLRSSLGRGNAWDWWFNDGHLYQIWLQPIYFGQQSNNTLLGFLAVGEEIGKSEAQDFSNVASSQAVFRYGSIIAASTLSREANEQLAQRFREGKGNRLGTEQEIEIRKRTVPDDNGEALVRGWNPRVTQRFEIVRQGHIVPEAIESCFANPRATWRARGECTRAPDLQDHHTLAG